MKTLIINMHPNPSGSSYGKRIVNLLKEKYAADVHEIATVISQKNCLMDEQTVKREQQLLLEYERFIFVSPMYWYSFSSLGHAWVEQIMIDGFAFNYDGSASKLRSKEAVMVFTAAGERSDFVAEVYGTEAELAISFNGICRLCTLDNKGAFIFASNDDVDAKVNDIAAKVPK